MIIWLTGQPGSGKTTLANELKRRGVVDHVIDGDEMRALRPEGYDYYGRHRNVERAQDVARWLDFCGRKVAVAMVAPYRAQREEFKRDNHVREVYLYTTESRGKEEHFVSGYEEPETGCLFLDTGLMTISECVACLTDECERC